MTSACEVDWAMILQYITVLRYPLVIISVVFYFREELKGLLQKIRSFSYGDATLNLNEIDQQKGENITETIQSGNKHILEDEDGNIRYWEDSVIDQYNKSVFDLYKSIVIVQLKLSEEEYNSTDKRLKRLINYSTVTLLERTFERLYGVIYGSQIKMIQQLNHAGEEGLYKTSTDFYYKSAVNEFPELYQTHRLDIEAYYKFLIINQLISLKDSGQKYIITDFGKEFIKWLYDNNKSLMKMY